MEIRISNRKMKGAVVLHGSRGTSLALDTLDYKFRVEVGDGEVVVENGRGRTVEDPTDKPLWVKVRI